MGIKQMNGKPLLFTGFADFGEASRSHTNIGKHTTFEAFEAAMKRTVRRGFSVYGWTWAEWGDPSQDGKHPSLAKLTHLREPILRPQIPWHEAKDQARGILVWQLDTIRCCFGQQHVIEDHRKTTRHFFYWCLANKEPAVTMMPWTKELIAEDELCRSD